ncbi:related to Rpa43-43 kD subunit of DNA-directed RNA polymerase I [Ustilago bromivora]|uniref:Related to Rpa43 - 43 kD subunit of DNA-directed RNA polymerase I n=1 Tax=Ustilago bromivora TaxID=307758 RepID=A0A1K0H3P5_9BASI|nr:related to Rpa43-43 kD subunit of DNA-directed RNA polymerase I [Ustilago bromivora]SYW79358.1 related to Rpa43 - 43 kD subunit of DNA-directed RNA polymerase I [Ustilago bromivora]
MSKDKTKSKDKSSKRRDSSSSSSPKKSRKSSSSIDTTRLTLPIETSSSSSSSASTSPSVTSAFETLYPIIDLPIPPVFSTDPYSAFSDLMDTLVMRYIPPLSGVLITHSPTRFLQDTALFSADSAFATASLGFECIVWRPKIGQMLEGTIALSSPSHVSLLLYGLFNASIPASHLPEDEWEFLLNGEQGGIDAAQDRGMGYWRNKLDGSRLGASDGKLKFTVISLTIANHMLSLHGSLLKHPFSGPPPTLDRSYLKKSLLPSTFGLGTTNPLEKDAADSTQVPPAPTPRRVRWEDEDQDTDTTNAIDLAGGQDSSAEEDEEDVRRFDTPATVVKIKSSKKENSKRKSTSGSTPDDAQVSIDSPKREKKRRKEA